MRYCALSTYTAHRIEVTLCMLSHDSMTDIEEMTGSNRSICCRHAFTGINVNNYQLWTRMNNFVIIGSFSNDAIRKIALFKNVAV